MATLYVRIPPVLHKAVKQEAERNGMSVNRWIQRGLEAKFGKKPRVKIPARSLLTKIMNGT